MKDGWIVKKLGEICEIYQPKTISTSVLIDNGKYLVYGANGVIGRYNEYNHEESELLMTCRGATCGTINISKPYSWINGNAMVIHPKGTMTDKMYLKYVLCGIDLSNVITGAAQPQITRQSLSPLLIPIPALSEQSRIVEELDQLSNIIEKKRQQLSELENLAQSIFYDMFGDPNKSIYKVAKLSEIAEGKMSYGSGASAIQYDGEIRYVRITDIKDDGSLSEERMSPNVIDEKYILNDGDILFARSGATVGKTYLYNKKDGKAIYAGYLIRFKANTNIVLPKYIFYFTHTAYYKSFIKANAQAVAQPNINAQQYGNLKVCIPPLSLQQLFAQKIEAIEAEKALIKKSIAETEELFNSRMDYYFS